MLLSAAAFVHWPSLRSLLSTPVGRSARFAREAKPRQGANHRAKASYASVQQEPNERLRPACASLQWMPCGPVEPEVRLEVPRRPYPSVHHQSRLNICLRNVYWSQLEESDCTDLSKCRLNISGENVETCCCCLVDVRLQSRGSLAKVSRQ